MLTPRTGFVRMNALSFSAAATLSFALARAGHEIRNGFTAVGEGKAFAAFYLPQQFGQLCFRLIRSDLDLHDSPAMRNLL